MTLLVGAAGCDGGDEGNDEATDTTEGGGELSHAADIQPIWDANCVTSCHTPGGTAATVLDLSGDAYEKIVDVNSGQAIGKKIVAPGSSADSYLMAKLAGTHIEFGGNGGQMPSGGAAPLDATTQQLITDWIDGGALP